jgi:hypothetical protein
MKKCKHPDPKIVSWVFCRNCGYFVEGVRIGPATDEVLQECLEKHEEQMIDLSFDDKIG